MSLEADDRPIAADPAIEQRQMWMRTLATADLKDLADAWSAWEPKPAVESVRGPEAGLVMVRGRIDAGGARFNLGEASVVRATMRLSHKGSGAVTVGSSYVLGTDLEHARLAAVFDGLLADEDSRPRVLAEVITPIARGHAAQDAEQRADAQSTVVDFFTVAREHE